MKHKVALNPNFGYYQLDPVPTQEEVNTFYAKEFYDANADYFNNSSLEVQKKQQDFFDARWENTYQIAKSFFKGKIDDKEVFDIGFGFAQALIYLKNKGLSVSGLEPSIEGVKYAKENGINAYRAGIENFDIVGDNKYDLVLLMDVLEHLRNPEGTIENIKNQLLTEDGLLVIDVPNDFNTFQQVANAEYGLDAWWVVSPNHINYFSKSSLVKLLEHYGFEIVDYQSTFPLDMFLLFGDQYIGNPTVGRACHNKRVNFEKLMRKHGKEEELVAFYKSLADLNLGRTITVFATLKK